METIMAENVNVIREENMDLEQTSLLPKNYEQLPVILTIDEIVKGIHSNDPSLQYVAAQSARKILGRDRNPPIDLIINHGIVPNLIRFLDCYEYPELQFEATWTLTNLAYGTSEQTKSVVDAGGIPKLVSLLESPVLIVAEQALWALANIAGDGPAMRDCVLKSDVVKRLVVLKSKQLPLSFEQNIVYLMLNLCRWKNPKPSSDYIEELLPILSQYLFRFDTNILINVCWVLSYISDDDHEKNHAIIQCGILPQLINLLRSPQPQIVAPALRTIGNIVTGTDNETDAVLEVGVLPYLKKLLKHPKNNIVKLAAWTTSNIAAGNRKQIQKLFRAGIFHEILFVLTHGDFGSKREAAWAITNTITCGSFEQAVELIKLLLNVKDQRAIKVVLNGLENMLALTEQHGRLRDFCGLIEEANGLDRLELLQSHENAVICQKAYDIVNKYFNEAESVIPNGFNANEDSTLYQHQQTEQYYYDITFTFRYQAFVTVI